MNAQLPENRWVIPNQAYLKISVTNDGIYKVTGSELRSAGWDLNKINTTNLQVYYRGKEVGFHLETSGGAQFDESDFLLFYGKKNDGSRDSLLYRNTERANPFHSLYSDTSAYFLTVGRSRGKRIEVSQSESLNIPDDPFHLAEDLIVYDDQFSFNNIIGLVPLLQQSYFEEGEGRTGKYIVSDSVAHFSIPCINRVKSADYQPTITYRINGRSRINHQLAMVFRNNDSTNFDIPPFGFSTQNREVSADLISDENLSFSLTSKKQDPLDWYSMTFIKSRYPQGFSMNGNARKYFNLVSDTLSKKAVKIPDLSAEGLVWNITDSLNPVWIFPSQDNRYVVESNETQTKLLAVQRTQTVNEITPVRFRNFSEQDVNYLIITHESLLPSAETYAQYRASASGGNYKPLVTTSQELYDTFNFGEESPVALRKFAEYMTRTQSPKHLLLLGRGVSFPDELKKGNYPNLVPTIGYPASDALISAGLNGFPDDVQAIPTGRLNVTKNEEVLNYLEKVQTVESKRVPEIWQKDLLHLSGGQNENEIRTLKSILSSIVPKAENGLLGGKVGVRSKQTNLEVEPIDISKAVNEGLGMITFVGHGSANQIDLNIGYCSPPENGFANEGKYPIMFFNGCGVGNVFYRYNPLSTDWLLTPKRGAVAVFANSFWSYAYPTQQYLDVLYNKLFDDSETVNLTLGEVQQAAHLQLIENSTNEYIKANVHQMVLQGDPALRAFLLEKPDYRVSEKSIFISSINESQPISKNDSLRVGVVVQNIGRFEKNIDVFTTLRKTYKNGDVATVTSLLNPVAYQDTLYFRIKNELELAKLEVVVNSENLDAEYYGDNNTVALNLPEPEKIGNLTSFPENILPDNLPPVLSVTVDGKIPENDDFVPAASVFTVKLTDNQSLDSTSTYHFTILLRSCESCDFKEIKLPQRTGNPELSTILEIAVPLADLTAGTYDLRINARDMNGNTLREPYDIRFNVAAEKLPVEAVAFPNPGREFVQIRYQIIDSKSPESAEIYVYNTAGLLVYNSSISSSVGQNSHFITTKNLPSGRFFVKIIIDESEVATTSFTIR